MAEPPVPKLTLFFPDDFGDPAWAGTVYALEAPSTARGEWVLGRAPDCNLTIRIKEVSLKHAVIAYSYLRDRWTLADLESTNGTFHNGVKMISGQVVELKLRDRIDLAAKGKIQVVEDEDDTIRNEDSGPVTISSTTPLATLPTVPPLPTLEPATPPSSKTPWDSLYLGTQWVISGQTTAGKIYRLIVAGAGVAFFILMMDWLTK
ncbi:FHA domain-containing protein [Nodosilinea sp. FACHB-13]|uniref:FHA domain-containing protein n=1 Tax=Cyanophyceae TaxID=3028117 RepID=UPI001681CA3A|nr:FHA domain-containing protein [Nodosilinea sp. FACHB-13]MBD2107421.1 FHA domain-containing protein [Nodosilinea sp. FACHB-13]